MRGVSRARVCGDVAVFSEGRALGRRQFIWAGQITAGTVLLRGPRSLDTLSRQRPTSRGSVRRARGPRRCGARDDLHRAGVRARGRGDDVHARSRSLAGAALARRAAAARPRRPPSRGGRAFDASGRASRRVRASRGGDVEREKEDAFRAKRAPDAFSSQGSRPGSPSSPSSRAAPLSSDEGSSPTGAPSLDADAPNASSLDPDAPWSLPAFPASPAALRRFPRDLAHRWDTLPSRYRLMFGTTCAFVLCNMDKVNISVAIIPMAKDMGWSVGQAGVLQSAFFYGFALSQLPGGYLATRFGGAKMLPVGVFVWSAATCAVPFLAGDDRGVFLSRVLVGLGEGISPAAATDVIARSVSVEERGRAVAFVFNGFNVGSVLGLSLAPLIIETFGWRSVFVAFGGLGLVWCAWVGGGMYRRGGATPARFDEYEAEASRETVASSKGGNALERRRDGEFEGKEESRAVLLEEGEPRVTPFDDATGNKPVLLKGPPGPLAPDDAVVSVAPSAWGK